MTTSSPAVGPVPKPAPPTEPGVTHRRTGGATRAARRAEFDDLVVRAYPVLVAEAVMLTDDRGRSERLVRRALASLWRDWGSSREQDDPLAATRTWLHEQGLRRPGGRGRWWRRRATGAGRAGVDTLTALRAMPQVQRRAIVLHHGSGRSPEQIAALEGVSPRSVRMRLAHGAHGLAHHHPATPTIPITIGWADLEGADPDRAGLDRPDVPEDDRE